MNSAIIQTAFRNSSWFMTENLKFRSGRRFQISTFAEALEHRLTEKSFFFHMELCIFSIPYCIFVFPTTSLRTYFTQLCSTFLNKLTKIIVCVSTRDGRVREKRKKQLLYLYVHHQKHDKYTSTGTFMFEDEYRVSGTVSKYAFVAFCACAFNNSTERTIPGIMFNINIFLRNDGAMLRAGFKGKPWQKGTLMTGKLTHRETLWFINSKFGGSYIKIRSRVSSGN